MNPKTWVDAVVELIWRIGVRIVLWVGLGYALYRVRSIIVTLIIAAVLTYAVLPIVDFLCSYRVRGMSRKFQRFTATLLVFIGLAALTVVVIREFIHPFEVEISQLAGDIHTYADQLKHLAVSSQKWYHALPEDAQHLLREQNFNGLLERVTNWGTQVITSTIAFFKHALEVILIPVLAFYFTLGSRALKREFVAIMPRKRAREILAILHEINCIMRSYVIGQIILCVIAGVAVGVVLHFLEIPYVLILGLFAGITRAVPVIGPIMSGIAIVLLGLVATKSSFIGMNLLIFFTGLHFMESKFIMPKLIGDRMQLHPVVIIVVLLIGAEFFGIFGMFMAAPVAAIIRVLVRYYLIKPKELRVWGLSHYKSASQRRTVDSEEAMASLSRE